LPLYVYVCPDCKKAFDIKMKLEDYGQEIPCLYCQKPMELKIQPIPFRIK
jgi:DNA-directed RNA polymerase subunit RPC12/RpoP